MCACSPSFPECKAHAPYYIVICGLSNPTKFFHTVPLTARFSAKHSLYIKLLFSFSVHLLSKTFLILRRIQRDTMLMYIGLHVKFLSHFNKTWIFSMEFLKKTGIRNLMKIGPVGDELFLATGQTYGRTERQTKLIAAFRSSANAPKSRSQSSKRIKNNFLWRIPAPCLYELWILPAT